MPASQNQPQPPAPPPSGSDDAPRFATGTVPEAPPQRRGLLVFGVLLFVVVTVVLLRALSGGTPFVLAFGAYFPAWFSAGVVGAMLAAVTMIVLRSHSLTRSAGSGFVYFNCTVIYAFLAWLLLFH